MFGLSRGYPSDGLTDSHVHYLSVYQFPEGYWNTTSYRTPTEYGPFTSTALTLVSIKLYPLPGRYQEFEERLARAKRWLLGAKARSMEEHTMQLIGLAAADASKMERAPSVKALESLQNMDGSWSQLPTIRGEAFATGEALYALHVAGDVATNDPMYQKGVKWLLQNQLPDGSWFVQTRALPVQPHTFELGFPGGWSQFISGEATNWACMALLFTLPDSPGTKSDVPPLLLR